MSDYPNTKHPQPIESSEQIAGAISHDFRSSARQVKSFTQLLEAHLGDEIDAEGRQYLDVLGSAADVLQAKLDALDRFSASTGGRLQFDQWNLRDIVDNAMASISTEVEKVGAVINVEMPTDAAVTVFVDRARLETVFVELVRNALTFCQSPVLISIRSTRVDDGVLVRVTDTGPGFTAKDYNKAFDLFRRFHLGDYPGTGTGLAVVRRILERHGTVAAIHSDPDGGTAVEFTIT